MKRILIVGAGLGGLLTAGLLAARGNQVTVLEKAPILGGRSHMFKKDGFTFSYGAHAVLAPKSQLVRSIFNEIGVELNFKKASLTKFKVFTQGKIHSSPLGMGALTTAALPGLMNHFVFLAKYAQLVKSKPVFDQHVTVADWIHQHAMDPAVAKMLEAFAKLSIYDGALDRYSLNSFLEIANCEYSSLEPLGYACYEDLLQQLKDMIINRNGQIRLGCKVQSLIVEDGKVIGVKTDGETLLGDSVIVNAPPRSIAKMIENTPLTEELTPFLNQSAQYVYVYDVMLSKTVRKDLTNLLDLDSSVYINDYGLNVPSSVPGGGQLLCCMKFLTEEEQQDDQHAAHSRVSIENILDQVYTGWRNHVVGTRIINRAMVNGIARHTGNQFLPMSCKSVGSLYFVGDSTAGLGGMSLPAFDSARKVSEMITNEAVITV